MEVILIRQDLAHWAWKHADGSSDSGFASLAASQGIVGYGRVKRLSDFLLALILLVVTSPLVVLAAVLVKLTSRGSALYSQTRLGLNRVPFRIYKLRTMYDNCEHHSGPRWATVGDPRITTIGRLLRRTHVDELPQLWNVLKGEMSLVGPRPERPELIPALEREILGYTNRLLVRPGITGLAQLQLPPDTDLASVRRKLACDIYYVRRSNLWLDLGILCGTFCYLAGIQFGKISRWFRLPCVEEIASASADLGPAFEAHVGRPLASPAQ